VIAAGVLASGILATGADGPGTYDYAPPPPAIVARVRAIEAACRRHDVPLRAAALRFVAANPHVTTLLLGAGSPHELADARAMLAHPVPQRLWDDLRAAGLLPPGLPTPA
jgi:D-threo-aldose 1-dehydrogenase